MSIFFLREFDGRALNPDYGRDSHRQLHRTFCSQKWRKKRGWAFRFFENFSSSRKWDWKSWPLWNKNQRVDRFHQHKERHESFGLLPRSCDAKLAWNSLSLLLVCLFASLCLSFYLPPCSMLLHVCLVDLHMIHDSCFCVHFTPSVTSERCCIRCTEVRTERHKLLLSRGEAVQTIHGMVRDNPNHDRWYPRGDLPACNKRHAQAGCEPNNTATQYCCKFAAASSNKPPCFDVMPGINECEKHRHKSTFLRVGKQSSVHQSINPGWTVARGRRCCVVVADSGLSYMLLACDGTIRMYILT